MAKQVLPKEVEEYLENNLPFNKFGLVNIKVIQTIVKEPIDSEVLKKLIGEKYDHEMIGGKVEFI